MPHKTLILDKNSVREGAFSDLKSGKPVWTDITQPSPEDLAMLAGHIGMESKEIEHLLILTQRPKLFNAEKYSVVVFAVPVMIGDSLTTAPLLLFVSKGQNDLITVHREHVKAVSAVHGYALSRGSQALGAGVTHLLHTLLEEIVDSYFEHIGTLSTAIESIEKKMFEYRQSKVLMRHTFATKKSLLFFHRALIGNREVVQAIEKHYAQFLDAEKLEDFRELSGDITQLIEMATTYHDILTTTIQIHLSAISNNLNVTMKKLTSWAAIILVPSLIAAIFGMNFREIPLLSSHEGFAIAIGSMAISIFLLGWYFKRKDWL